ncbi:PREDICTED: serine/threonine-protein phosphatase 6 regulatory ankyrin repeat subunit C-like [Amphimedon queenslandica]|uniref:Non-specific serine/threonine protein kinase n=1 Tax=Amphimedon queenslandica TaxID=400682 RepID=A0AAN0J608_AMPQE|nr:PREDICTED: serine/threonine-protein phosphatase 6 regulatory ankyrin repeat subunit C-like [Amphimedon queenslandica]|eukprot:XP_019852449.1 PREDICTED: serine/threonine-protein phosphatase 6 regulatory ankyrin repeat subunit C-like [Amphimedon queenslandica]
MAESAPEDKLLQSAENGDQKRVLKALEANADIKCINESKETALHLAARKGHLEIVEILLTKGANVTFNFNDKNKWTPLDVAVKEGHEKIAKLLVEKGCPVTNTAMKFAAQAGLISTIKFVIENNDIDLADCVDEDDGQTLLHHAAEYEHTDVVELLLNGKRRVDVNCKDFFRIRPIHLAVQKGNITIVQMLVDHNADVNCKDLDGMAPLHHGFKTKNQPVVEHLLYYCEANPDICDKDNKSILYFAIDIIHYLQNPLNKEDSEYDKDKLIRIFEIIVRKADVNIKDKDGNTPLLYAVLVCSVRLVTILLENKANPNIRNNKGHIALQYAVSQENLTILTLLLDYNADLNARMTKKEERFKNDPMSRVKMDETALHFIIRLKFSSDFYKLLLNRGADLKICDADGYTALYYAAMNKDYDLVIYLNTKGADIKVKDTNGLTLLHHAAIMNSERLTEIVLANKKLDVNMACKKGYSALQYALMKEREDEEDDKYCSDFEKYSICSLLIERGAQINCKNEQDGMTPLLYAVLRKYTKIVEIIIDASKEQGIKQITIQATNKKKMTALHIAISNKDEDILNLLLDSDHVLNEPDENGMSPLHCGSFHGFLPDNLLQHKNFKKCLNYQNENTGKTALHYAVECNNKDEAVILLDKGANLFLEDNDGHSSLYYAIKNKFQSIIDLFFYHASKHCDEIDGHQISGWLPLHYAIQYDNFSTFCVMVEKHFVLDMEMKGCWTPLHIASCRGVAEVVDFIVGKISSIDYVNKLQESNSTAMHLAAKNGHYDIVKLLHEHGADAVMNYKDAYGMTPLNYIVEAQSWDFLDSLNVGKESSLRNLSDVPHYSKYESAAILYAAHKNEEQIVKRLISVGANVDSKDKYTGNTPLHIAAENNYFEIVKLLLSLKANPNSEDKSGARPMNMSYKAGGKEVYNLIKSAGGVFNFDHLLLDSSDVNDVTQMKTCLENGAEIDYYDKDERTALHYAVLNNHFDSVLFLIENGCNINCQDRGSFTAVHYAVINGYHKILETLISNNADLNVKTEFHEKTALHYAVESLDILSFELLINSQAINVNEKDWKSITPLHSAAQLGCADMVQRLLNKNANVNCRDMFDLTPLHFVCDSQDGRKDILQLLLEAGADPHLKELRFQHTPLHKAAVQGHFEIISFYLTKATKALIINDKCQFIKKLPWTKSLRILCTHYDSHEYEISCESHESKTALHLAAENGHAKAVEVLLNHNASIDIAESETFKTALHLAAENGHKSVVKVLVERGANLRKKDYTNKIPFHYAIKYHKKDKELIELLTVDNFNLKLFDNEEYEEIHDAGVCGRLDIVKLNEASIKKPDERGRTVFHYAAENGHLNVVQYLLSVSDPEIEDNFGYTPLYFAVSKGYPEIVLCLLQSLRVDKDKKYGYCNQTLLHIAAEKGFNIIVQHLLHSGAECNAIDEYYKKTPLHVAAGKGHERIVQLLLENGASIHIKDYNSFTYNQNKKDATIHLSYTPLHYGVESGNIKTVQLLLQKGIPLRYKESWNKAITNAACKGYAEVIQYLIQTEDFDITLSDQCTTPLYYAILYCQKEVIRLFLSYTISISSLNFGPMHIAAEHGLIDIAELLREHEVGVDDEDKYGLRPLHYACRANQVEMVDYLLRTGGVKDPMKVSKEGLSPLDVIAPESTARTKLLQLFRPYVDSHTDYPIETYAKVFMCGYSTAGKSSLSQALVDRSKKPLGYKFSPLEKVKDVTPFTVGIDLHTISSPEIGNIVLYDFAGHTEFYSSHAGILENLMLHSPGVFVIIADLTKPRSKVQSELFYWLNFIENACAKLPKPSQVILVGSRADSFSKHGLEFKADMNGIVEEAVVKQIFKGYCALECHKPGGIGIKDFVSILATSCEEVVNRSDGISYYCHLLYSLLKDLNEIAITFENLSIKIKENSEVTIPDDPAFLSNTLLTLTLFYVSSGRKSEELDRRCTIWKDGIHWISHNIEVLVQIA